MIIDKKIGVEKKAFTLVEMSVAIVIIAVMLSTIIVSKILVTSAKINKIQQDYRDINILSTLFQNTFDCLPGDCQINNLTPVIINATPSACFNLSTTTGMGDANSPGNTSGTTTTLSTLITMPNSSAIASPADRTCAFYQMQAFEITGRTASIKQLFAINNANAIGRRKLDLSVNNPIIAAIVASSQVGNNAQLAILNADASTNGSIAQTQASIATNNVPLATLNANESTNGSIAQAQANATSATNKLAALNSTATSGTVVNGITISATNNATLAQTAVTNANNVLTSCNSFMPSAGQSVALSIANPGKVWTEPFTGEGVVYEVNMGGMSISNSYGFNVPSDGTYTINVGYAAGQYCGGGTNNGSLSLNGTQINSANMNNNIGGCGGTYTTGIKTITRTLTAGVNKFDINVNSYNVYGASSGAYTIWVTDGNNNVVFNTGNASQKVNGSGAGYFSGCPDGNNGGAAYCGSACAVNIGAGSFINNGSNVIATLSGTGPTSISTLNSTLANLQCQKNGTTTVAGANCTGVTNLGGAVGVTGSVAALNNTLTTLQAQAAAFVTLSTLQAKATDLNDKNVALTNPNNFVSLSIPTATNPQVPSFDTQAMWDLRTVGSMSGSGFYPFELNDTTNLSSWKNKHILIARNSVNTSDLIDTSATNTMAALPTFIAKKIDIKYDDGMPYTGNIISGQNISKMGSGTGCTTSTTISAAAPTAAATINYIASGTSDLTNGCVVAWKLDAV